MRTWSGLGVLEKQKSYSQGSKPDNLLLDEKGHVHLTDFNIATILEDGKLATSMSGTKPYMAPEIFSTASEETQGYSFGVDWWSLGVCIYEILRAKRPYEIHANTSLSEVRQIFASESVNYPTTWSRDMIHVLHRLLQQDPKKRLDSLEALKQESLLTDVDWEAVEAVNVQPSFVPPKDHLNCDPTYELEEMIIEAKPLHKKKKRLKKLSSKMESEEEMDPTQISLEEIKKDFKLYNRERLLITQRQTKTNANPAQENSEEKTAEMSVADAKPS